MKVGAIANAIEQYNYQKNKVSDSEKTLMEYRLLDVLNDKKDVFTKKQEEIVEHEKIKLNALLDTDVNELELLNIYA